MQTADAEELLDRAAVKQIVIPYRPREWFWQLHRSTKRFRLVVAHRRAGKSVAEINELIKKALENNRPFPPPRYAYIGPTFAQTKDLIWGYIKHYLAPFGNQVSFSESDLQATLPNGAMINLYGGSRAYDRMRGLYFDGAVADEFALLDPDMFGTVVRPCLADYRGWFIASGTSNGDDHFHDLKKRADADEDWDVFSIPVTKTTALHPDELVEMTKDMTPDQYAREMLCSFEAPIAGSYYGDLMNIAEMRDRIRTVNHDPSVPCFTWWDLGIDDALCIWIIQSAGGELHAIDYIEDTGKGLEHYAKLLKEKPYVYKAHVLPHDVRARELGTGRSRFEVLWELLGDIFIAPSMSVEDGIQAARTTIPLMYFDAEKTARGRLALRNYARGKTGQPIHNWASHGADAYRVGSVALRQTVGIVGSSNVVTLHRGGGPIRRRIRGLTRR